MSQKHFLGWFRQFSAQNATLIAVIVVVAVSSFLFPHFRSVTNLMNLLKQASLIGILAIGMTFVVITGGIDLSVGSVFGFSGVVAGFVASMGCDNALIWAVAGVAVCTLLGAINGFCIVRMNIPPFIVTLAMMTAVKGFGVLLSDGGKSLPLLNESFGSIGKGHVGVIPIPALFMLAGFILAWFVGRYTVFGRNCYAVGGNQEAAISKGVDVGRVKWLAYTLMGFCAGVAGIIVAARTNSGQILVGDGYEMNVIAAVVIGGTMLTGGEGRVMGSLWGTIIITLIGNLINLNSGISYLWQGFITGALLLLILIFQSRMSGQRRNMAC